MMNDPKPQDTETTLPEDDSPVDLSNDADTAVDQGEVDPEDELEALRAERDSLKDRLLRALAEAENTRRRAQKDRDEAAAYGGTKLARDLLAVYDNLDRALKAADDSIREQAKDFIDGVELTQRELLNAFAKHQIEAVNPDMGEKFDPNLHQAMFEAPVPGAATGSVIQVMQQGFTISGRLLRPALVGVAKADPNAGASAAQAEQNAAEPPEPDAGGDQGGASDQTT